MTDLTAKVAQSLQAPHQMPKPLPDGYVEWLYGKDEKSWDEKEFDESKHPRGQGGKFTEAGGEDGGDEPTPLPDGHPGKGYSASAYVKDGVIHTNSVYDAQRALNENRKVELDQPKSVSILIQKLGEISAKMIAEGKKAPDLNLCNVSLKGTNLFCADNVGLKRIEMPQLDKQQTKDFQKYLKKEGYKLRKEREYAANLRATQKELIGAKVADGAKKIEANDGKVKPIIISKDDYVLDGHHAWAAKLGLDAADNVLANDTKMNVIRVNIKITKLLEEADKFTGGKGRKGTDEKDFVGFGEVFLSWEVAERKVDFIQDPTTGHLMGSHGSGGDSDGKEDGREEGGRTGSGEAGSGGTRSPADAQRRAEEAASGHPKLEGLPDKPLKVGGSYYVPGPFGKAKQAAEDYMAKAGLPYNPPKSFQKVDKARAARIADEFEKMKHDPNDPAVKASYAALAKETLAQWQAIKATGLKVEWIKPGQPDPYAETPRLGAMDITENNHWWGFPTDLGFGTDATGHNDNPMLQPTNEIIGGRPVVVNDVFRIVHDYFGHFKEGVGFRADGEDNAWQSHVVMYSEAARGAMTSETRGQNSWVNYGPYGESNRTASAADTHYAPQKVGIMPEWTWREGLAKALHTEETGPLAELIERGLSLEVTRRIYVRSHLMVAHRAIAAMDADGFDLIPYDGEHIPGTELIDTSEWEERSDWDEGKHPRDDHGRFGSGGGGGDDIEVTTGSSAQTKTPEFKQWFGDSKVVDKNGDPLVVYHGTRSEISEFRSGEGAYRGGIIAFFSSSPKFASDYAANPQDMQTGNTEGANILPVYLKIEHPFDYRTDWTDAEAFYSQTGGITDDMEANRILMGLGKLPEDQDIMSGPGASALSAEDFTKAVKDGAWDAIENDEFVEWLREGGTDGIVETEGVYDDNGKQIGSAINYGVFEPTQVKSATGNSGDFDPDDPDITKDWEERKVDFIQDPTTGHLMGSHGSGDSDKDGEKDAAKDEGKPPEPSAEAMAVGGDEWNKETAERLEKEYVEAAPKLDKIVADALAKETQVETPDDTEEKFDPEDAPIVPDSWDMLSDDQHDSIFEQWKTDTFSTYQDAEIESWQENSATDDAGQKLAWDFTKGGNEQWAIDGIEEARTAMDETKIPFTNEQLINALVVSYEGSGYNDFRKGLDISIDDSKLGKPIGWGEGEEGLPGIEPPTLTKDMREALIEELSTAFAKEGENVLSNLEPPEYLNDSIAEMQDSDWDQMEDKEKFAWTESHTDIVSNAQDEQNNYFGVGQKVADAGKFYMPNKIDPMQEGGSGADYTATQKVARHLSIERASQIMVERGIYDNIEKARADAKRMDTMLWNGWKGSSHNNEGQLLQKATAEELGGRLNLMMITSTTGLIDQAIYVSPGAAPGHAYDAVKAYVRGKWETSQFLLKKAGLETVELYRAVNIPDTQPPNVYQNGTGPGFNVSTTKTFDSEAEANKYMESQEAIHGKVALGGDSGYRGKVSEVHNVYRVASVHSFTDKAKAEAFATKYRTDPANPEQHSEKLAGTPSVPSQYSSAPPPDFTRLPDIQVERNGAASATTDRGVANKWDGKDGRVVLRASVPRTAVVSVPAYGINVEGEHEVVIAGTAWKGWDAWYGAAPQFDKVKIGTQFAGAA